ncbi:efflux RND transporter periplasmic adaptor subunit [Alkaliphilus peptidifermentans]|uniref:HlyD family secretion protein n=1 Tax=Alkaliphilus peptidifermentans DSM 18978 TaxID=1120976 RepID=A0A1G5AI82_9FIRM|nr:efflux RND transporter periplasmic adaptor subunit [Alkaliphilus peptidifermentans]SCX77592.1 HlyD family secretion protein [Alkaliphilus peptidifermentans DSM 18978]
MKKKTVGIILAVVVLAAVGFLIVNRSTAIEVETATVIEGSIAKYVEELGVVKAKNQAGIYAPTAGRVIEVLVKTGDQVEAGEILVKLDQQQLERQKLELQARRAVIEAQYKEATKVIDAKEIEKLELELTNMERRLEEAVRNAENKEKLYKAGAISFDAYRDTLINLESQKTNYEKSKLDLAMLKTPTSQNIAAQYEAQLRQLDIQMEELTSKKEDFALTSPMKGTVMLKSVEVGSILQPSQLVMEIGNIDELYIESDVLVGDIANIKEGASVRISNKSLGIKDAEGVVKKIHPQAFSKISDLGIEQKRISVEIEILNNINNIRPGYDLDIEIITDKRDNTLIIPENAVFQQGNKSYVFINVNNQAQLREIEKGIESQKQVEVISGLNKGELVIISPDEKLKDGTSIKSHQNFNN